MDPPLIFGVVDEADFTDIIGPRFRESYPQTSVECRYVEGFKPLAERFIYEFQADEPSADLLWQSEAVMTGEVSPYLTSFPEMSYKHLYPDWMLYPNKASPTMFTTHLLPNVVIYNSDLVEDTAAPKSWLDLADPRWKGRIIIEDPRSLETSVKLLAELCPQMGEKRWEKFLQGLASNQPFFTKSMREAYVRVARGEFAVAIDYINDTMSQKPGTPVKVAWPQEEPKGVTPGANSKIGISKKAIRPKPAQLFVEWLLSPLGQKTLADTSRPPALLTLDHANSLGKALPQGVKIFPPNPDFAKNPKKWEKRIATFFRQT